MTEGGGEPWRRGRSQTEVAGLDSGVEFSLTLSLSSLENVSLPGFCPVRESSVLPEALLPRRGQSLFLRVAAAVVFVEIVEHVVQDEVVAIFVLGL